MQEQLHAAREARRARRKQHAQSGGGRKAPRFPPQPDSTDDSGADASCGSDGQSPRTQSDQLDDHRADDEVAATGGSGHVRGRNDPESSTRCWRHHVGTPGSNGDQEFAAGTRYPFGVGDSPDHIEPFSDPHMSDSGSMAACSERELPHHGGCRTPSAGVPLPPPAQSSSARYRQRFPACRMVSWDISRPRCVLERDARRVQEGVKVSG